MQCSFLTEDHVVGPRLEGNELRNVRDDGEAIEQITPPTWHLNRQHADPNHREQDSNAYLQQRPQGL